MLDITPEELDIEPDKITSNYYISENIKKIKKKIPPISKDVLIKYSFITDHLAGKDVIIYEYKKFLVLKSNDYFGDTSIETNTPRNATIIAEEETDMAYLPSKLYYEQVATEKASLLERKITSLYSRYFFNKIKYEKFAKKYYYWFVEERYIKDEIIFNEGEDIKYLYFIQEGSVELSTSRSMKEIESLINLFIAKKERFIKTDDYGSNGNKNEFNLEKHFYKYSKTHSSRNDFVNYINQKQRNKLIILNHNEDIGLVSFFLGKKYITTGTIISNQAKLYKIDVDYLKQILRSEYDCKYEFFERMKIIKFY